MKTSGFGLRPLLIVADLKAAHKRRMLHGIVCGLLALCCTPACFGGGVTVITHGFQAGGFITPPPPWLDNMAVAVINRASSKGVQTAWYRITVHRFANPTMSFVAGLMPADSNSGEIGVLFASQPGTRTGPTCC